jgi:hypothetical protein
MPAPICIVVGPLLCRDGHNHITHVMEVSTDGVTIQPGSITDNESAAKRQRKAMIRVGVVDADLMTWVNLVKWAAVHCGQTVPEVTDNVAAQQFYEPDALVRWQRAA